MPMPNAWPNKLLIFVETLGRSVSYRLCEQLLRRSSIGATMLKDQPLINWLSFVVSVHRKLNDEDLTMRDLQQATDISPTALHHLFAGGKCPEEAFLALCKWLERDPTDFYAVEKE
ncbi:hypothetical protein ACMDCR_16270 [Labrys okinawensis]|uniref:hypothetical protein n=1 Tax=Labrys okinawensis TaxID=346911 RepID=UPI0039BD17AC